MLNHHQLEQYHRVYARSPVILAVASFYYFIDVRKVYCLVYLPQHMILRHQHVCAQHLYRLPLLYFLLQNLSSPVSIIAKKATGW